MSKMGLEDEWHDYVDCCDALDVKPNLRRFIRYNELYFLEPPIPNIIGLGVLFLGTLATIAYGYFHGNMHLITTLKNARG